LLMVRADLFRGVVGGLTAGFFFFVAVTSQRGRYLVPVYPAALVLSLEAMARVRNLRWAQAAGVTAIAVFLVFGLVSNLVYAVSFVPVVMGIEPEERLLSGKAPQGEG